MVRRPTSTPRPPQAKPAFNAAQIERGLGRLDERIRELQSFNIGQIPKGNSPALGALEAAIQDTIIRCFGEDTLASRRFLPAAHLQMRPIAFSDNYPLQQHYQEAAQKNIAQSIALLGEAKRVLQEEQSELSVESTPESRAAISQSYSRRVFIVHGHDEAARETVARFLTAAGFEPIILHEQANQGRTVIEKVVAHGDVGFAVVLLTPDDVGSVNGGVAQPRARQNVVLELGYFIGRLGRDRVCALKKGEVEIPSDFGGVVYEPFDSGNGWKLALGRELRAAGYEFSFDKALG